MTDVDALLADAERTPPTKHPEGWTPGVVWNPKGGTICVPGPAGMGDADPAFWEVILTDWGLDPQLTEIVPDSIEIRAWDMNVGKGQIVRAKYYKAKIRPRRAAMTDGERKELVALAMRSRKRFTVKAILGPPVAFVLNLSDFQIGKGEGGGTTATVARIIAAIDAARNRLLELRKAGRNITEVWIVGMGDLAEQCFGHYPSQPFTVDRTRREQLQEVRKLIMYAVDSFVELVASIKVRAVPGNHGENRVNGKKATTDTDNDDLAVFEQVAESWAMNPERYGHVDVKLADGLVQVDDVAGITCGWTHMHQGNGSGEKQISEWWKGQVMGVRDVARATILFTAHFHHLLVSESTGRTHMQMPAMDGGSGWWTEKTGQNSHPGMVSLLVGEGCGPRGWSDLAVL